MKRNEILLKKLRIKFL
jgi:hypothetical protein